MPALLVTYELKSPDQDYSTFHSMLHSYPSIKLSGSSVVLATNDTPANFFEGIWPWIDQNDTVLIFEITNNWSGVGSKEAQQWLKERL